MERVTVWLATVFGLGRLPVAPGTWGSAAGLALGATLVRSLPAPVAWSVLAVVCVITIPICGRAERVLGGHDPAPIVLDECCAMALIVVALPWALDSWVSLAGAFVAFRAFDILKPPPVRWLERWSGGWGILADDLGAAGAAIIVLSVIHRFAP